MNMGRLRPRGCSDGQALLQVSGSGAKSRQFLPLAASTHPGVQTQPVFCFVFPSLSFFFKNQFNIFLSKSASRLCFFGLGPDPWVRGGGVLAHGQAQSLASCLTRLDFRLQTVKTSLQKRLTQEERNP